MCADVPVVKSFRALLFPAEARRFPGQRGLNVLLRALHLVGVSGIGGGFLFGLNEAVWLPFWWTTLASGIALTALYLWSDARWLLQLKGLVIVLKLLLLALAMAVPELRAAGFVLIVLLSAVIAHAPGRLRGYTPWGSGFICSRDDGR